MAHCKSPTLQDTVKKMAFHYDIFSQQSTITTVLYKIDNKFLVYN